MESNKALAVDSTAELAEVMHSRHLANVDLPKVLSAAAIASFFAPDTRADQAVAKAEKTRLSWILGLMFKDGKPIVAVDNVRDETAAFVADTGLNLSPAWKSGKGATKAPPKVKVARVRASQIRTIYGAIRFAEVTPEGKGFDALYALSAEALLSKGIKWDGTSEPTAESRKARNAARQEAEVANAANAARVSKANELGRTLTTEERAAIIAKGETLVLHKNAFFGAIEVANRGAEYAEKVMAYLPGLIEYVASTGPIEKAQAAGMWTEAQSTAVSSTKS